MNKKKRNRRIFMLIIVSVVVTFGMIRFLSYTTEYASMKARQNELNELLVSEKEKQVKLETQLSKIGDPEYLRSYAKENYLYTDDETIVIKLPSEEGDE